MADPRSASSESEESESADADERASDSDRSGQSERDGQAGGAPDSQGDRGGSEPDGDATATGVESESESEGEPDSAGDAGDSEAGAHDDLEELSTEQLRERVEREYDFEDFDAGQMREMDVEEWEAAFDPDSWITGDELLDRVTDDLRAQIASREVFAVLEEVDEDGERRLLAYSDEGYAMVYPDGSIEGFGTVLRDVKPTVALCSMDSYDVPESPPDDAVLLPTPEEVPEASGEFGNLMLQVTAGAMSLSGLALVVGWLVVDAPVFAPVAGVFFVLLGVFLFASVANARLSDRFRAEEYRERLRAVGLADGERPDFLPVEDGEVVGPDRREAIPEE